MFCVYEREWVNCRPVIGSSPRDPVCICSYHHDFIYYGFSCLHLYLSSSLIGPFLFSPHTQLASPPAGAQSDQTDSLSGLWEARQKCPLWLQHDEEGPGGNANPCESRLRLIVQLYAVAICVEIQFGVISIALFIVVTCRGFTETQNREKLPVNRGSRRVCKGGKRENG